MTNSFTSISTTSPKHKPTGFSPFDHLIYHILRTLLAVILASGALGCLPNTVVKAATLTVTTNTDSGAGSLRQAILDANAGDTITFASGYTISLETPLVINKNLTIDGENLGVYLSGQSKTGIFNINNTTVVLNDLILTQALNDSDNSAAIFNNHGTITIENCIFSSNLSEVVVDSGHVNGYYGGMGGAIINNGSMTINNSHMANNMARDFTGRAYGLGGAIYNNGTLTINKGTFSNNNALTYGNANGGRGGVIYNASGTLNINDSYFYINSAQDVNTPAQYGQGGVIYNAAGSLLLKSSLLVLNTAKENGGAVANAASAVLINNTLVRNEANLGNGGGVFSSNTISMTNNTLVVNIAGSSGGGMYTESGTLNSINNLISASVSGGDCALNVSASMPVNQKNLVEDGSCLAELSGDPKLDSNLQDNGGPTLTLALLSGSPAIDAGSNSSCPATDQRGVSRDALCDIGAFEVDDSIPSVTIDQASTQADPTGNDPILFTVVFSKKIDPDTFSTTDITLGGTVPGTLTASISEIAPHNGTTFRVAVSGMSGSGSVLASIPAAVVKDFANHDNTASSSMDNSVTYTFSNLVITGISLQDFYVGQGPDSFTVTFNRAVYDPTGDNDHDDVTNPNNFLLLNKGGNGKVDTLSCSSGVQGDDIRLAIGSVNYNDANRQATIRLDTPLAMGSYHLMICGSTSIIDLFGNALNGGSDYGFDLLVNSSSGGGLPATGFAPGASRMLTSPPADLKYTGTDLVLEIPSLHQKMSILGVPQKQSGWDVTWLGQNAGWLNGSAFPTHSGNTLITGHVWDALNHPGPFAHLKDLKYGDLFYIHAFGQTYTYEVRENSLISPLDSRAAFKKENLDWVSLLTCESYDAQSGEYQNRRLVRAVRVDVQ